MVRDHHEEHGQKRQHLCREGYRWPEKIEPRDRYRCRIELIVENMLYGLPSMWTKFWITIISKPRQIPEKQTLYQTHWNRHWASFRNRTDWSPRQGFTICYYSLWNWGIQQHRVLDTTFITINGYRISNDKDYHRLNCILILYFNLASIEIIIFEYIKQMKYFPRIYFT